jgi:hypothetical protein
MKLNGKYFFGILVLLLMSVAVQAQVQFSISVSSKEIGRKDELHVEYVIIGTDNISNFKPPYFPEWKVVSGPDFSSVSYDINGKKDQVNKYSYVLIPDETGKLKVPGTSIDANGRKLSCSDVVVSVSKKNYIAGVSQGGSNSLAFQGGLLMEDKVGAEDFEKESVLKPGEDVNQKIRNNLFIKAIPSKKKCYVGEPILVMYKLYTRLKSNSRVVKQPSFSGCSVNEMTTNDIMPQREKINGKEYNTYLFRKVQLFPLQAGKLDIGQASVENTINFYKNTENLRDAYYGIGEAGEEHTVTLTTDPLSVEVIDLPKINKPAGPTSVGNFIVIAKLKKDTIPAKETNSLIVSVIGSGNFKNVSAPEVSFPDKIYRFDATETDELDKLSFPLSGKKVFEIPFEANATGAYNIPAITLSYFDPAKGSYQTTSSQSLKLTVTPAVSKAVQTTAMVKDSGFDTRYMFYLLPIAFLLGGILIWRKQPKKKFQTVVATDDTEPTHTVKRFDFTQSYNELLLLQDDTDFYLKAREFADEMIRSNNGNKEILVQVLKDCNQVLYTPIPSTSKKEILEKLKIAMA